MFKKVLVVEDIDSINIGVASTLKNAFTFQVRSAKYCDKAFLMLKEGLGKKLPFDLMITDLSFRVDHIKPVIKSGEELISLIKAIQPDIKVLIYSIEDRPFKISQFVDFLRADGYVLKGRNSSSELVDAINAIAREQRYISPMLQDTIKKGPAVEIDDYDLELIKALADGHTQQDIVQHFSDRGISPTSLSSIEKRLNRLKDYFMAKNTPHLVAIAKDMGLF